MSSRKPLHVIAGAAAVVASGALILVPFLTDASHDPWMASATITLALATAWLGWQTREVSRGTEKLVETTQEEMDLLRQQTKALTTQAETAQRQFEALERQREEDLRPLIVWRMLDSSLRRAPVPESNTDVIHVQVQAINEGGHVVGSDLEVHATVGEVHDPPTVNRMITRSAFLPVNLRFGPLRRDVDFTWTGSCSIRVRAPGSRTSHVFRADFKGRLWPDNLTFDLVDAPPDM